MIKQNREALDKTLWTNNDEGEKIEEFEAFDEKEEAKNIALFIEKNIDGG